MHALSDLTFESTRTVTQEAFAAWALARWGRDSNRYELINGRIVMTPPATYPHGAVAANIVAALRNHVRAHDLGMVFDSSQGFALASGDTVEPDVSFVSKDGWRAPAEGSFVTVAPDLVVEILSPSTASRDRGEKKAIYAKNGVRELWLVDSRAREALRFALDGDRYGAESAFTHGSIRSLVLADFEVALDEIFPP